MKLWNRLGYLPMTTFMALYFCACSYLIPTFYFFQLDSDQLLYRSAEQVVREGNRLGGFMNRYQGGWGGPDPTPYCAQFGLHYNIYTFAADHWPWTFRSLYRTANAVAGLLLAAVLCWLVKSVNRFIGSLPALCLYVGVLVSAPIIAFSTKVYWMEWLFFLPIAFSFACYDALRRHNRLIWCYAVVGLMIFVKSLCGYEYLSAIHLSAALPLVFCEWQAGSKWPTIARRLAAMFVAGVLGFAAAYALTFVRAYYFFGSADSAWKNINISTLYNTVGDNHGRPIYLQREVRYFAQYAFLEGQGLIFALTVGAFILFRRLQRHLPEKHQSRFWALLLLFALMGPLSWNLLARGHMRTHYHIDFIVFYIPFNFIAFVFFGVCAATILRQCESQGNGTMAVDLRAEVASESTSQPKPHG